MDLITFAQKAIGVPFVERGRDFTGWDCWGLVWCAYKHVYGIDLPSGEEMYTGVMGVANQKRLVQVIASGKPQWMKVDPAVVRPGDVILMKIKGRPVHTGLILTKRDMLHVDAGHETGSEPFREASWVLRTEGFYRYRGK